jgi:hypothetical protein
MTSPNNQKPDVFQFKGKKKEIKRQESLSIEVQTETNNKRSQDVQTHLSFINERFS